VRLAAAVGRRTIQDVAGFLDFDWRRLFRWCCLGAIVLVIWLMVPSVKCSFKAFEDTPISDVDNENVAQADKERVQQGTGFWSKWGGAMKSCYNEKPLLGQEAWKRTLLFVFLGIGALAWSLDRYEKRRKRTFER
jgi:hypothetical protein